MPGTSEASNREGGWTGRSSSCVDDRLELHALRDRIAALPREERWEALARRALWEDIQREHRTLTADVLRESENGPVGERVNEVDRAQRRGRRTCTQVLADVKAGDAADLATLSVAVREIRNLIEATVASTPGARESVERPVAPVSG